MCVLLYRPASRGWERVEGWAPCAIGSVPSAFDPNGSAPAFQQPQVITAPGTRQQLARPAGALANSTKMLCLPRPQTTDTSIPGTSGSEAHEQSTGLQQMTAQRVSLLLCESDSSQDTFVWQTLADEVRSSEASAKDVHTDLLPYGAVVKVL